MTLRVWRGAFSTPPLGFEHFPEDVELTVGTFSRRSILLGRFERHHHDYPFAVHRRATGGRPIEIGEGTLYVGFSLPRPDALVDATPTSLLNRLLRPVLRALSGCGKVASYTGRDFIAIGGHPIASVGFAYEPRTGHAIVEAYVALTTPFTERTHGSFRGRSPTTLEALGLLDAARARDLGDRVVVATEKHFSVSFQTCAWASPPASAPELPRSPGWDVTVETEIGTIGYACDPTAEVGGEWMTSEEAPGAVLALCEGDPREASKGAEVLMEGTPFLGVTAEDLATLASRVHALALAKIPAK